MFTMFDKQYQNIDASNQNKKDEIAHRIYGEIEKFLQTIQKGEKRLKKIMKNLTTKTIPGAEVFTLYDTFGFPLELTQEIAEEKNYTIDIKGFDQTMKQAKSKAKADSKNKFSRGVDRAKYLEGVAPTIFV
jgi:alanyl-tRNA synthetase